MSGSAKKDHKERYNTYSITGRAANKEKGIEEEVVTKKMAKFIDGGPKDFLEWTYHFNQLAMLKHWNADDKFLNTTRATSTRPLTTRIGRRAADRLQREVARRAVGDREIPQRDTLRVQQALSGLGAHRAYSRVAERELVDMRRCTLSSLQAQSPNSATTFEFVKGTAQSDSTMEVRFRIPQLKRNSITIYHVEVLYSLYDDMAIGRDLMTALGLVIDFKKCVVQWDGSELVVNTTGKKLDQPISSDTELTLDEALEHFASEVGSASPLDLLPYHLDEALQHCYLKVLEQFADLYSGCLGRIRLNDYVLPLRADDTPEHARPYSVPHSQVDAARRETQRLIELDVIEQIYGAEASAPAFFMMKHGGSLRLSVDFHQLNKFLRRSPYNVPKIREILLRLGNAKCVSTLDANTGYLARRLARQSRPTTAFCLPFGKFQFKRLPMGISTAPDEYQACMERILGDLPFAIIYLDDIISFSENAEVHLDHLRIVFDRLRQYDVTLIARKCNILRDHVDYLGFTLTANGIQPQMKKVDVIQQIAEPRNKKELRCFLGMIVYYRDMVHNKSAMTARLKRLTATNIIFTWTPEDGAAFREIKSALARNVWLAFPDYNRPFHVFADSSGRQVGGVILQGKRIIACFSRSMTDAQRKYSTKEWELLSLVEIFKEYRTIPLGFPVIVHTNHKNLLFPRENSLRGRRWKLLLEEYRLQVEYVPGHQNVGANAFSRLRYDFVKQIAEEELFAVEEEKIAIDGAVMKKHQRQDTTCMYIISRLEKNQAGADYSLRPAFGVVLLHRRKRVVVPESLRHSLVELFHDYLLHPGAVRPCQSMSTFWWPGMQVEVAKYANACVECKKAKLHGGKQQHGHLPPTPASNTDRPFDVVYTDWLGPFAGDFYYLTVIEQQFRWLEVIIQRGKTSSTTAISFECVWLCRYPCRKFVVHDQGPEFTGDAFQLLLASLVIKDKPITAKNPQANAICERVHLEIMNILRVRPDLNDQLEVALDYAAYAIRAIYHSALRASPAQLMFGEDMITRELHLAPHIFTVVLLQDRHESWRAGYAHQRFPPVLWNIEPIRRDAVSRTNNLLERLNREMNAAFSVPHPNLPDFVVGLEKLARRYAHLKYDIDIGRALASKRLPIHLPTPVVLPDTTPNADVEIISAADPYEDSSDEEGDHTIRADPRNVIWRRLQRVTTGDLSHIQNLQGYYDEIRDS
ncbi:hypothetical protein ON010_g2704 [Phytophthora cinnamomi]|nr:hypothetical protein ON010_g2704 [Phytophthora cinnamomi]